MLIFATFGVAITAIAGWSALHGQNGFAEIPKMLRGEPAFVVNPKAPAVPSSGGGTRGQGPDGNDGSNTAPDGNSDDRHGDTDRFRI